MHHVMLGSYLTLSDIVWYLFSGNLCDPRWHCRYITHHIKHCKLSRIICWLTFGKIYCL